MKKLKTVLSLILACAMCVPFVFAAFASEENGSYTITNPYSGIDWENIGTYKTALHTHTTASDGDYTLKEMLERHAQADFDIVAVTDHGTVNYGWGEENVNDFIYKVMSITEKGRHGLEYLGSSGSFADGVSYTYSTAANGDDYLKLSDGKTILRLPYGIENNAVSVNAHVNSWFTDYTDNSLNDYEQAISSIDGLGGICVINHPGEYTKARYELHSANAYNTDNLAYRYYVNKFTYLLDKYDGCIGIDINSKGDNRTRFDRILWDTLLERFAANGESVYAIASSDAHTKDIVDTGYSLLLMPELTNAAAENALRNGEFFAASHCLGNYEELTEIAASVKEFYGETELYGKLIGTADAMEEKIAGIENGSYDADDSIGITYTSLDSEGYTTTADPEITYIGTDEAQDTITIGSENALIVRWISNGKLIATTKADTATLDLNEYSAQLGDYVRAEVFGEGGVIYTQAFLLNAQANAGTQPPSEGFMDAGIFDFLFAIIKNWTDILTRTFANLVRC